jgi:hypothetical protein
MLAILAIQQVESGRIMVSGQPMPDPISTETLGCGVTHLSPQLWWEV